MIAISCVNLTRLRYTQKVNKILFLGTSTSCLFSKMEAFGTVDDNEKPLLSLTWVSNMQFIQGKEVNKMVAEVNSLFLIWNIDLLLSLSRYQSSLFLGL